mmetsp:Transcript_88207/g.254551  ORF Transcript_88207/g.254551 Transcript_88207/m.254551 type:complete len:482 (-) Transcript_88207:1462-2907(-)
MIAVGTSEVYLRSGGGVGWHLDAELGVRRDAHPQAGTRHRFGSARPHGDGTHGAVHAQGLPLPRRRQVDLQDAGRHGGRLELPAARGAVGVLGAGDAVTANVLHIAAPCAEEGLKRQVRRFRILPDERLLEPLLRAAAADERPHEHLRERPRDGRQLEPRVATVVADLDHRHLAPVVGVQGRAALGEHPSERRRRSRGGGDSRRTRDFSSLEPGRRRLQERQQQEGRCREGLRLVLDRRADEARRPRHHGRGQGALPRSRAHGRVALAGAGRRGRLPCVRRYLGDGAPKRRAITRAVAVVVVRRVAGRAPADGQVLLPHIALVEASGVVRGRELPGGLAHSGRSEEQHAARHAEGDVQGIHGRRVRVAESGPHRGRRRQGREGRRHRGPPGREGEGGVGKAHRALPRKVCNRHSAVAGSSREGHAGGPVRGDEDADARDLRGEPRRRTETGGLHLCRDVRNVRRRVRGVADAEAGTADIPQ